ncbi:MAG TPA: GrpB family protein [Ilumatobacteraceae bacterium]
MTGVVAIVLEPYSSEWPEMFAREKRCIESALDGLAIQVHHTGSTSVPGLRAKPIIDITLAVPDSTDEHAYLPALVDAGYELVLREPEWFEHRLLRRAEPRVNLHIFSTGSSEIERMLAFRDRLRVDKADRSLYESTKVSFAQREWDTVQDYADAKTDVVREILERAKACRDRRVT